MGGKRGLWDCISPGRVVQESISVKEHLEAAVCACTVKT